MAYADWAITGTNNPILNSSLSNPLLGVVAGSYCRELGTIGTTTTCYLSASYSSGAFVGVPSTKVIRAQTFIRRASQTSQYRAGIFVKQTAITGSSGYGYGVMYNAAAQAWRLGLDNGSLATLTSAGNPMDGTWASFRMDVFPLGAVGDRIIVYRESSPGSDSWTALSVNGGVAADGLFVSSSSGAYAAWGGSRRCGVVSGLFNEYGGTMYFDKTYFAVSNAP